MNHGLEFVIASYSRTSLLCLCLSDVDKKTTSIQLSSFAYTWMNLDDPRSRQFIQFPRVSKTRRNGPTTLRPRLAYLLASCTGETVQLSERSSKWWKKKTFYAGCINVEESTCRAFFPRHEEREREREREKRKGGKSVIEMEHRGRWSTTVAVVDQLQFAPLAAATCYSRR